MPQNEEHPAHPIPSESLRILFTHNAYQNRGGEDSVVDAEVALLRSRGHKVQVYTRHNEELNAYGRASAAADTLWSQRTVADMSSTISSFRPDIIHAHNTFPLISPSLYWAAARGGVPLVQTLHNFRLLCPQGVFLREGRICEECLGRLPWRGVMHRCYRKSAAESTVLCAMLALHRGIGSFRSKVTRYIALNEFCRRKFIAGGIPAEHIAIKPNFVDISAEQTHARSGGLFVGRLSQEKGVAVLVDAVKRAAVRSLEVVGSGPEEKVLATHGEIRLIGWQEPSAVIERMRHAAYLVMPSICYESFPRTVVEAFACGLPVIASRLGALAEIIEEGGTGLLFDPGSGTALAEKLAWAERNPEAMRQLGQNARSEYERKYTPEINYQELMVIYAAAANLH